MISASDPGNNNRFISPESFSTASSSKSCQRQQVIKDNYLLGKRRRPLLTGSVVAPSMEEKAADPSAHLPVGFAM